jgi:hypothetical protein
MDMHDKRSFYEKMQMFSQSNWFLTWIAIFGLGIYIHLTFSELNEIYANGVEQLKKGERGVVMLDMMGRPAYSQKTVLDGESEAFKKAVKNIFALYMISGWQDLTDNFSFKVGSVDELKRGNKNLVEFQENYFSQSLSPEGLKDIGTHFETLVYMINNQELPEVITINSYNIIEWKVKEDTFKTVMTFPVSVNYYVYQEDRYTQNSGTIEITATGKFLPLYGNPVNPLGIVFYSLKSTYISKSKK